MAPCISFAGVSDGAGPANEDFVRHGRNEGWVLDGATSISGRRRDFEGRTETDAAWFVRRFSEALERSSSDIDLQERMCGGLAVLEPAALSDWGGFGGQDVPSASFAHVAVGDGKALLTSLGDCRLLYRADGGPLQAFGSSGVEALDAILLERYRAARGEGLDHRDAWQRLLPTIRAHRALMNRPGGYWILSPDGAGVAQAQCLAVPFARRFEALLVTDGLYRLVDTYSACEEGEFFESALAEAGLDRLLRQLREIERGDPEAEAFPRFKLQDDASGLAVRVVRG